MKSKRKRWTEADALQRHQWLREAQQWNAVTMDSNATWTDFTVKERVAIRKAMAKEKRMDMDDVTWLGSINFQIDHGYYKVDLIQGDNFSERYSGFGNM